jgi:hypothetical protein
MTEKSGKLRYKPDWEADRYFVGKKQVTDLTLASVNGFMHCVVKRRMTVPYSDHGHSYEAVSDHFFIQVTVGGITFERDLNTLAKEKITALEWK